MDGDDRLSAALYTPLVATHTIAIITIATTTIQSHTPLSAFRSHDKVTKIKKQSQYVTHTDVKQSDDRRQRLSKHYSIILLAKGREPEYGGCPLPLAGM